ncbi:MAG: hypothetical protein KTR31_25230 [Myxococcales bacterium]|nr:hypothetical protein [Myxococcales bacterium]
MSWFARFRRLLSLWGDRDRTEDFALLSESLAEVRRRAGVHELPAGAA